LWVRVVSEESIPKIIHSLSHRNMGVHCRKLEGEIDSELLGMKRRFYRRRQEPVKVILK
jgi:hypothetical protein